jgi:hypothetical protein
MQQSVFEAELQSVPAGKSHTEEIGPNVARIVVARKY